MDLSPCRTSPPGCERSHLLMLKLGLTLALAAAMGAGWVLYPPSSGPDTEFDGGITLFFVMFGTAPALVTVAIGAFISRQTGSTTAAIVCICLAAAGLAVTGVFAAYIVFDLFYQSGSGTSGVSTRLAVLALTWAGCVALYAWVETSK